MDSNWRQTLENVERSVNDGLLALGAYESRFAAALREPTPIALTTNDVWDARLSEARTSAAEIDRFLAEAEDGWAKWMKTFTAWRQEIQQQPGGSADGESRSDPTGGGAVEPVRRPGEETVCRP